MEILGRPETVAETQMEVRIQSMAQKTKSKRAFFKKQETVDCRRKIEMTMRCQYHSTASSGYLILEASLVAAFLGAAEK